MTVTRTAPALSTVADHLMGWDHLEWWVGNARAVAAWLTSGFGFHVVAYAGPETGIADRVSYVLAQGEIRFVVTAGLDPSSEVAAHVLRHGDGVRHLAWRVDDAASALHAAAGRGARVVGEPCESHDGTIIEASVAAYGETDIAFVQRVRPGGIWAPGFTTKRLPRPPAGPSVGLESLDHVVANVEEGRLDEWVEFHESVLGFVQMKHFDAEQISTEYSALRSTVMWDGHQIVLPINEPAPGRRQSQIQEYLNAYGGPGVQHIAMATRDICSSVQALSRRGVRFLDLPKSYYDEARVRCGQFNVDWAELQHLGIEIDADSGGYLLQIFSENVADRPTLFTEIIQREGATGFGEGNFKALFEAIEREQARRGHL